MSNISFNPQVLEAEGVLQGGISVDSSGVVSFNPDSIADVQNIFADAHAWAGVENGRNCILAASAKILVDSSKDFFDKHPDATVMSLNLPLGADSIDHRINRELQLTSSYVARGAAPEAEELSKVYDYAKVLFADTE